MTLSLIDAGLAQLHSGNHVQAIKVFEEAIREDANNASAFLYLGDAWLLAEQPQNAHLCFERAVDIAPESLTCHRRLIRFLFECGRDQECREALAFLLNRHPNNAEAFVLLANLAEREGNATQAVLHLDAACQRFDHPLLRLRRDSICPDVLGSEADVTAYRSRVEDSVSRLRDSGGTFNLDDFAQFKVPVPFNTTYQGRDDRQFRERYAEVFRGSIPHFEPKQPHGAPHLGFHLSRNACSVFARLMVGVVNHLPAAGFRVTVVGTPDALKHVKGSVSEEVHLLPTSHRLSEAATTIYEAAFDVLFYFEAASSVSNYFLPFVRLAPVQVTTFGVQNTTGIEQLDIYLSSELVEAENAQRHYTEELSLLPSLMSYLPRDREVNRKLTLGDFGINPTSNIYACIQNIRKLHPDFDPWLGDILRADPRGRLVIGKGPLPRLAHQLRKRFKRTLPDVESRIDMVPLYRRADYLRLLELSHVGLDPLYYGGVNTSYDAIDLGVPVVTMPSEFQRGRYTLGCYRRLGYTEPVADSVDDFIMKAVKIGGNAEYRHHVKNAIAQRASLLFDDRQVIESYEAFFAECCQQSRS